MIFKKQTWSIFKLSILLCLFIYIFKFQTFAQSNSKGATISSVPDTNKKGNTWAVIVGISKYQNIQGLNYADKDALAFYDYLLNKKGIDKEHIQLLINEKAIASDIYGALDWLDLSVKENDRVIFYFSGHGDVETKTIHQNGFLLANDAPVAAYMTKGTIGVNYLQDYLETYVAKRKVKDVLLIVDACRSGKLAGGSEGIQITMHSLGQTWNNQIIKVLSAQEGEASFEDKKWGGGRGVFSFYLVKGLEGLANKNADSVITTAELAAYLPFAVADATGSVQNPTVSGNPKINLFSFNKELLALASHRDNLPEKDQLLASRGTSDELDLEIKIWFDQYRNYLQKGRLIWGEKETDTINCAKYYYLKLVNDIRAKKLLPTLKSSFMASLKHKSELKLDGFIKGKKTPTLTFNEIYKELLYAKSLVDSTYILYNYINARLLCMEAYKSFDSQNSINLLKKVLKIEPDASYAYYLIGIEYLNKLDKVDSAIYYFNDAAKLSPYFANWVVDLAKYYYFKSDFKNSIYYAKKAIELEPQSSFNYIGLAKIYRETHENDKADSILIKLIEKNKNQIKKEDPYNSSIRYIEMGEIYTELKDYNMSIKCLKVALNLNDSLKYDANLNYYDKMASNYAGLKNYDNYIKMYFKAIEIYPQISGNYYNIACGYSLKNETKRALEYLIISFEKGYRDYDNISLDSDLTNIRQLPQFKELIKKYFPDKVK